jgi:ArsR family metal-binding transcriptional regulator
MYLAAFPQRGEYEKMRANLDALGLSYRIVTPEPAYSLVGCPALVIDQETRSRRASSSPDDLVCSGWIDYRHIAIDVPEKLPPRFPEDLFGTASIMVLAPCIADQTKVRLIAHLSGDLTEVFPYLNAEMKDAIYNHDGPTLTFMEGYRMITLYPRRIAVAKADDLVDGWRVLESIRCHVNEVFARRSSIEPLYAMRKKPPAIEIYKRLPGTNCRRCGQNTCMAFALSLHNGQVSPFLCRPVFEEDYAHLKDDFREIVARLGFTADGFSSEQP